MEIVEVRIHEIDFFGTPQGLAVMAEAGLTKTEVLEVQLMLIGTAAAAPIGHALAHIDPPENLVDFAISHSPAAQLTGALIGEEKMRAKTKSDVHATLHLLCALGDVIDYMIEEKLVVQERAQANYEKLVQAVIKHMGEIRNVGNAGGNVH